MRDEIFINLDSPIECHYKGSVKEFDEMVISSPNSKVQHSHIKLESAFIRAISSNATNSKDSTDTSNEESDINAKQIVIMLMVNKEDVSCLLDEFRKIVLCKGMSKLIKDGDEVEMTSHIYESIKLDDLKKAFGEYIKHFILASIK